MILIRPCSEWFQTFSGKVNDELVWELGQTCASCSEWYHNNLQLNNHGGKNSKSTYSNGWILFHFEHINIFFNRDILWNIIILEKISIIIFTQ